MVHRSLLLALLLSAVLGLSVEDAPDLSGRVHVIDADTFDVGEIRVRLHGVDAPESDQTCLDADGQEWPCGAWSVEQAEARWEGRTAGCERLDIDRYGRTVARCEVNGIDLGATLVSGGMALAYRDYSDDYLPQEASAQGARVGVWRGEFQIPQDYRRGPTLVVTDVAVVDSAGGCQIKGNISGTDRIYHRPGGRSYAATRIDESAGERWFCSEEEAQAAGWRAAR
ncbi:thermonuclease family protein [Rubellimicrobium rubrum]|uniref:Thermonuclease family protein n=1 Tax=Rubellimicrobium rubrum TaxID=2585369 RepID=A0A5C4MSY3_9RHOB|nr:thermonuclease family protein [Rubellimicrobium rubrum]TNC47207.1 thermonuclease family protein [Rubellimicrobium rubrum]